MELEINKIENELKNVNKELNKTLLLSVIFLIIKEIEEIDNLKFSKINEGLSLKVKEKEQEYKNLCVDYQESVLNTLLSKCIYLNKICMRNIYELDSNSKNISINDYQIVNKKKFNNLSFNEISLEIEQQLIDVEKIYNLFKSKV